MARLREAPDDLFALVGRTAEAMRLPPEFVEKDYWITELLRSIARPVENAHVVFKGGTSLSKGYELIRRFSEDVDILLVPAAPGGSTPGKGSVDRILKGLCARAQADLGISGADAVLESSSTGVHRNMRFGYAARFPAPAVKPGVLLEMGIRGGPGPRETRVLRSLVGRHAIEQLGEPDFAFDEFAPVRIDVLAPRRTLVEKLAVVHRLASGLPATEGDLRKAARHLYDIHQLLSDAGVRASLGGSGVFAAEVEADMVAIGAKWGFAHAPRPVAGFSRSPAFEAGHPSQPILAAGLAGIRDLVLGPLPTIEECRRVVGESADLL
ncbi:MAG: nucleotidyl transferase AbiEii/AbiGii toxin family protein [Planctomycetes bacterium]|nr:nucleotidyl transferase AbiEii/AbiGii toxin family protein [Planctomycetota bacterium]